jgi:iron-sulfur cluster assembly accessory protein
VITLSPEAVRRVVELRAANDVPAALCLRVKVIGGGCAGFTYDMYFDEPRQDDRVIEADGQKVLLDEMTVTYMDGTVIGHGGQGFTMENPQAVVKCNCGASFRTFKT